MNNTGFINENNIVDVLHNKTISELPEFWKKQLIRIFDVKNCNSIVCARVVGKNCKTDIEIKVNNKTIKVSIKTGEHNSIHHENVYDFIEFLRSIGVSARTVKIILFYHFGDGTLNGTGTHRMDVSEIKVKYSKYIKEANEEINQIHIIEKVFYRCLIKGANKYHQEIDYLYYGNDEFGYFVSVQELLNFALNHRYMFLSGLHFGPLNYQPYKRKLRNQIYNHKDRYFTQIKWIGLLSDIQKIKYITNKCKND